MLPPPLAPRGRAGTPRRAVRFQSWAVVPLALTGALLAVGCGAAGSAASSDSTETGAAQIETGLPETGGLLDGQGDATTSGEGADSTQVGRLDRDGKPLGLGDSGQRVTDLQLALTELGYEPGAPDGAFGEQTRTAVIALQKDASLQSDGIAGPKTIEALNERLDARRG